MPYFVPSTGPKRRGSPPSALLLLSATLSLACSGELDSSTAGSVPGAAPGTAEPGAPGTPGSPTAEEQAAAEAARGAEIEAIDAELAAQNPELFAIAEQYFPSDSAVAPAERLFRLTRAQLDATTAHLLAGHVSRPAVEVVPADPLQTNYEYASNLTFNAANFTPYTGWATEIATSVAHNPSAVIDCASTDTGCLSASAGDFVRLAFRHVPSDLQVQRFVDFFLTSVTEVGLEQATADLVDVVLTSPNYVFREEVLTEPDGTLLPAQRLQNITYALADAPPDALGLSSATAATYLASLESAQATIQQVLATPEARDKLTRFFVSWLEIKEADTFDIAPGAFPEFTPEVAQATVNETEAFLEHQLAGAAPALKNVTQSTQSFVSDALSDIYGMSSAGGGLTELDPTQRLGIFTQPAFIASHSGPETTRLVKRGVFFTRKVMCLPLGMPPEGTDTSIPVIPDTTERERVATVTEPATCQGCHSFINPFGFMLENYDPIGRYRTEDEDGLPIDANISVTFLDEGPLTADTAVTALEGFTNSWRFQQCFARQLFRFYMGRPELESDDPVLRQMFFNFANNDTQGLIEMLGTLAGSSTFSHRSETL